MDYIQTFLLLLLVVFVAVTYRKTRKVHIASFELVKRARDIDKETRQTYHQIQAYIDLKAMLQFSQPLPRLRGWAASPDFLLEIAKYALKEKPERIVECSSGASTLVLARCAQLSEKGHVYSLEHDEKFAEITRANLQELGLEGFATVISAPLEPAELDFPHDWYAAAAYENLSEIEMLVVDGPPANQNPLARYPALPKLISRMANNAVVFIDDADRPGEREIIRRWVGEGEIEPVQDVALEKGFVRLQVRPS